jgi:hypothetical protein
MAFMAFCSDCKKQTSHGIHSGCLVCKKKEEEKRKKDEMKKRVKMTIKKRLELIESDIYDLLHK